MNFREATQSYETWLGQHIPLIPEDLEIKHQAMRASPFPFLRATFYRWVQLWPQVCPELAKAPAVLAVGDLHAENLGIWRDAEGRMAWGINDFDEAAVLAYPNDLVRLATSVLLARNENKLSIHPEEACEAILDGYSDALKEGGEPFVLAESHNHLREWASEQMKDPAQFWEKLDRSPSVGETPSEVETLLRGALPKPDLEIRIVHRQIGLGSLGRQRYTAIANWRGGKIAREAKRLLVSAYYWQNEQDSPGKIFYQTILDQSIRNHDPFTRQEGDWIIRRIAPDCSRIELALIPDEQDESRLLRAMGWETANIHLGNGATAATVLLGDLAHRPKDWLRKASQDMLQATMEDWEKWH